MHHNDIIYKRINNIYTLHGIALGTIALSLKEIIHTDELLSSSNITFLSSIVFLVFVTVTILTCFISNNIKKIRVVRDCFNNKIHEGLKRSALGYNVSPDNWYSNGTNLSPIKSSLATIRNILILDMIVIVISGFCVVEKFGSTKIGALDQNSMIQEMQLMSKELLGLKHIIEKLESKIPKKDGEFTKSIDKKFSDILDLLQSTPTLPNNNMIIETTPTVPKKECAIDVPKIEVPPIESPMNISVSCNHEETTEDGT